MISSSRYSDCSQFASSYSNPSLDCDLVQQYIDSSPVRQPVFTSQVNNYSASRCSRPIFRPVTETQEQPQQSSKSTSYLPHKTDRQIGPISRSLTRNAKVVNTMAANSDSHDSLNRSDSTDGSCPICHEIETISAVAPCNHHICFRCSTRLRYLHQQFDCPICRTDCPKVLFVHQVRPYTSFRTKDFIYDRKTKALFEDQSIREQFIHLTAHHCTICSNNDMQQAFKTFKALQDHVRKIHQLFYCEICNEHVKFFSAERKVYSRQDLAIHKRKGDPDDSSFKGHPLCQLCDNRFLDTDEMWRHLRKDHFFCHFCDADGRHIYFGCYDDVKDHFREDHYLCEEDDCFNIQFTNSFRSELDLKAHKAQHHLKGVKRSQQKIARTLDIDITYGDERRTTRDYGRDRGDRDIRRNNRPRVDYDRNVPPVEERTEYVPSSKQPADGTRKRPAGRGGGGGSAPPKPQTVQEEKDMAKAIDASMKPSPAAVVQEPVDVESAQDFPSLSGDTAKPAAAASSPVPQKKNAARRAAGIVMVDDNEEFPGLAAAAPSKPSSEPALSSTASVAAKKPVKKNVTPAAVKAKSNPWSTTEDEFPTLEGTKAKDTVHGWHLPKPQPRPVAKPSFVNNARPSINSSSDFPTLGGSSSLASIGTWINKNGGSAGRSKQPAPAPEIVRNKTTAESAPHLNHYKYNAQSAAVPEPKTVEAKPKKKEKKSDKSGEKTEKNINSNNMKSDEKPKSKSKSDAPSDKITKSEPKPATKASQKESTKLENGYMDDSAKKDKSTLQSASVVSKEETTSKQTKSTGSPKLSNKSSKPTSKKMAALEASMNDDEFPTLASMNAPAFVPVVSKKSKGSSKSASKAAFLSDSDYPSLHPGNTGPPGLSAPPPGLAKALPPGFSAPPGLGNASAKSNGLMAKPPGLSSHEPAPFSMSSLAAGLVSVESKPSMPQYIEPVNVSQRNKKLSFKLKDMLHQNMDKFHKFRNLSGDFRSDFIPAVEFYSGCLQVLGEYVFLEILPELLVLLPDIQKQQDLYILCAEELAQAQAAKSWSLSGDATLSQCEICGQVVMKADSSNHEAGHGIGVDDFPTLATSKSKPVVRTAW